MKTTTKRWMKTALLLGLVLAVSLSCNLLSTASPEIPSTGDATPEIPPTSEPPPTSAPEITQTAANTEPVASPTPTLTSLPTSTVPAASPTPPPTQQVAQVQVRSQVRSLRSSVFTGNAFPLRALNVNDLINLDPNGFVTTDLNGEAEVNIEDCLKIFVFELSGLTRSTCRQADLESGLAVCSTAGITTVINNCLSQVTIQTPSSTVVTNGTMFSVIYLPEDQISLVQVYEGQVQANPVTDMNSGEMGDGSRLGEDTIWWSRPGDEVPSLNGIEARTSQPMEVWEAMRPELIVQYPYLDTWMNSARVVIEGEGEEFQDYLEKPFRTVNMAGVGPAFDDQTEFDMLSQGVWWSQVKHNLWPDEDVRLTVNTGWDEMEDARIFPFDQAAAQNLVTSTSFEDFGYVIWIAVDGNDFYGGSIYNELSTYFAQLGLNPEITYYYDDASLKSMIEQAENGNQPPLFWVENTQP